MNESDWRGKAFTGSWTATAGGTADVIEKATRKRLTTVGLAVAKHFAASARSAIFRKAARIIENSELNGPEFAEWIIWETGAVAPKADVELHMAAGILYQSSAMLTEPQGIDQTVAEQPHAPFGGRGASGNGTRIGGPANWEEFTQWQWLTIKDKASAYPF